MNRVAAQSSGPAFHPMLGRLGVVLVLVAAMFAAQPLHAAEPATTNHRKAMTRSVDSALAFLRANQNADGSFGDRQQHLQTALAILAFLSAGQTPDVDTASPLPRAWAWVLANTGEDGFLGDSEYPGESHAICAMALTESLGTIADDTLARTVFSRAQSAVQFALSSQDKAVGAEFYGGWKIDPKEKMNDRIVTAWHLLLLRGAELRGVEIPRSAYTRALEYVEGSQKVPAEGKKYDRADIGGFSIDASGLPVVTMTGAGLAVMSVHGRAESRRDLALGWLRDNMPVWYGPNFYTAHFFTSRAISRERARLVEQSSAMVEGIERYAQRLWELLRDHQSPDGSFQVPPGNAENTKQMGATYATSAAVLILNADRGLLPMDSLR